ncbi:MAG: helix-turn-helix transcriptional regulator [Gammaproteobacteria bacterium]
MPLFTDLSSTEWTDPDEVSRPVVTIGAEIEKLDALEMEFHRHAKSQFLLILKGVVSCEVEGGLWVVPPQSALWIPGGVLHSIKIAGGGMTGYMAFIDPAVASNVSATCCTLSATPLLRELLIRSSRFPMLYPEGGMESRLVALLLDEIGAARPGNLHLQMPTDPRLRKLVDRMMADPTDRATIQDWAERAGLSERTLARLVTHQTGMSFGRWRQQLRIMLAVQWLAKGVSIQQVSGALGYESAGSFVTMFRKILGAPPGRYMAKRAATPE